MPRCNNCAKFVPIEEADAEVSDLEVEDGMIRGVVTLENNCAECGQALKRKEFDLEIDCKPIVEEHDCPEKDTGIGWFADYTESRRSMRQHPPRSKVRKTFYGVDVDVVLQCNCGSVVHGETASFEVQASEMDDA